MLGLLHESVQATLGGRLAMMELARDYGALSAAELSRRLDLG
jgi:hypothetical protein